MPASPMPIRPRTRPEIKAPLSAQSVEAASIPQGRRAAKVRPSRRGALAALTLAALIATGCAGDRPTITTDRIEAAQTNGGAAATDTGDSTTGEPASPFVQPTAVPPPTAVVPVDGVERFRVEVVDVYPHDATAWTQGLEIEAGDSDVVVEGTGLRGRSELRRVDIVSGNVLSSVPAPRELFAEGLTRVDDRLIQLTWRAQRAFVWDANTFELLDEFTYDGEGWGLCYDGTRLVMSDGTANLTFRDPVTFDEISRVQVTLGGLARDRLNELECVDGVVWANIWTTDEIVRIDPTTGNVTGSVDASTLEQPRPLNDEGETDDGAVLNGIAWDAESRTFLVTGKFWPSLYRTRFVSVPSS